LSQIQERLDSHKVDFVSRQELLDLVLPFIESSNAGLDDMLYDIAKVVALDICTHSG
jgi:hypothetical protein